MFVSRGDSCRATAIASLVARALAGLELGSLCCAGTSAYGRWPQIRQVRLTFTHQMSAASCERCGQDLLFLLADGRRVCLNGQCVSNTPFLHPVLSRVLASSAKECLPTQLEDDSEQDTSGVPPDAVGSALRSSSLVGAVNWSPKRAADCLLAARSDLRTDPIACTPSDHVSRARANTCSQASVGKRQKRK